MAIVMDGNRRWAARRGRPARQGHRRGARAAVAVVRAAARFDIDCLTLFAFASANWRRPAAEVDAIFDLAAQALRQVAAACVEKDVRVTLLGRLDRLPARLRDGLLRLVRETAGGRRWLRLAIDYSSRDAILAAAWACRAGDRADFERRLGGGAPPVDLLIRTGGERRLSDFLLYECAFAELYFSELLWPDFDATAFGDAVDWFHGRERRFGA